MDLLFCSGATCEGASVLNTPGFWVSPDCNQAVNNTAECLQFDKCNVEDACPASSFGTNLSAQQQAPSNRSCLIGYQGRLCSACSPNYASSSGTCTECPDRSANIAAVVFAILGVTLAISALIWMTLRGAANDKAVPIQMVRILITHLQVTSLMNSFQLQWPSAVHHIFKLFDSISSVGDQLLSVDCLVQDGIGDAGVFWTTFMVLIAPVVLILGAAIFFRVRKVFFGLSGRFKAATVIILNLLYTTLTRRTFQLLNCRRIGSESGWFLTVQPNIKCFEGSHWKWFCGLGVPALLVWSIGIPALPFGVLRSRREKLHELHTKEVFGFLYDPCPSTIPLCNCVSTHPRAHSGRQHHRYHPHPNAPPPLIPQPTKTHPSPPQQTCMHSGTMAMHVSTTGGRHWLVSASWL